MVRASVAQLILFIAAISVSTLFVGVIVTETGLYVQAVEDEGDRETAAIDAEIEIINDPEAKAVYNETDETVTVYVKNVGGGTLNPDDLEVVVNGELATVTETDVIGGEPWRRNRVLAVTLDHAIEGGTNRALVRIDGSRDLLSFQYAGSLDWSTDGDWSAGTHERTVSDGIGDRDADTVRLGYDAGDSGLVAYWPFDEDSGDTAFDATGTNDGRHVNHPTPGQTGLVGTTAYDFDHTQNQHVNVSHSDAIEMSTDDRVTVSTWIKLDEGWGDTVDDAMAIVQKSDASYNLQLIPSSTSPEVQFVIHDGTEYHFATVTLPDDHEGRWVHVSGRFEADTEFSVSADGQTATADPPSNMRATDDHPLGIGDNIDDSASNRSFAGDIDEVRLFDRALTDDELSDEYLTATNGSHTTDWRTTTGDMRADSLQLENVSATLDGETVTVYVESDTTGDGTADEVSDPITLTESGEVYAVEGITADNDRFRLRLEFETGSVTRTPVVSRIELTQE
ncbi:LamG-like jellyroll fold domain-containing protein [Natrinema salinisoli]|uniref:LamG-like jellyroll fold domain-containing protein n=1 Tax=Natrinema salinisoli TaxID=2878535 RepID=UPI001CF0886A|nr:LamG-like jellyroll fold domain-containing protein [Natrinema salinisoli]